MFSHLPNSAVSVQNLPKSPLMHTHAAPFTPQNLEALSYPLHKLLPCFKHSSSQLVRENRWAPMEVLGRAHGLHQTCLTSTNCEAFLKAALTSFSFSYTSGWCHQENRGRKRETWAPACRVWKEPKDLSSCAWTCPPLSTAYPPMLWSSITCLVDKWVGILNLLLRRASLWIWHGMTEDVCS